MRRVSVALTLLFVPFGLSAQDSSAGYTEPYQQQALDIYRTIIGYRSSATHGSVPEVATYLAEQFKAGGFPSEDVHVLPFEVEGGEETAGLIVRYRGDGSSGDRPILLLAHMDVVDALPEDWDRDPFTLVEEDGYFFGRGSLDDKFGITMLTTTFLRMKAEGFVPNRDLVIAFTGDEETGMMSARRMVTVHRDLTDAEFALNADGGGGVLQEDGTPISYVIQTSEKTYATFELTVTNPGGHSSTPRTDNAIYDLATALKNIEAYRFPVMVNEATRLYLAGQAAVTPGEVGEAMARLANNPDDSQAAEVLWHQPEVVGITRTTCVATMLRGGHAENALPQSATATVNCRIFPDVDVSAVQATLERVAATTQLTIQVIGDPKASPASPIRADIVDAVTAAVEARYPGIPIIPYMAPYGTDGKETRAGGIPTYGVMGVFIKDSDQFAHGLNERVSVREFYGGLEHWYTILGKLAGRPAA
ncbi:MAG: M20/M25/M40 family metallo-hydrolase [Gemmatimonadetes bacterium]|jgi:carboxypeptidase PM20D1|nr:M20/M25/M40 family metallo-hydrolase [Gemmatimonadota bacterium]